MIANEGALVFPCRFIFYLFLGGSLFFSVSRVLSFVERSLRGMRIQWEVVFYECSYDVEGRERPSRES